MQISPINFLHFNTKNTKPLYETSRKDINENLYTNNFVSYPKNYQPYFGARIDCPPQDFYAQNMELMPITVKNYLKSDFENNSLKESAILQREAFEDLYLCENAKDVKELFPDEPLFKNLKSLDEINPRRGYLHDLKVLQDDNYRALKSKEDITIYLLKKIYLEGKTLEEINEDFKIDANPEFLDEANYSKNGYFLGSTLEALGVNFPKLSYWNSFQRRKKPRVITDEQKARQSQKMIIYWSLLSEEEKSKRAEKIHQARSEGCENNNRTILQNKERKPRIFTDEQKAEQSQKMIMYWVLLPEEERAKRIEKLKASLTERDNILLQYMSPIMIIAAERVGLSDKMVEFYHKYSMTEYLPDDISNLSKSQNEKLQKFWDENPQLKKDFSKAISETIELFRKDQENGQIDEFLALATAIRQKNAYAAELRKMSSETEIKKFIQEGAMEYYKYFPDAYTQKYIEFLCNHPKFKNDFVTLYKEAIYAADDAEHEKYKKKLQHTLNKLYDIFYKKYKYETNAAKMAVLSIMFDVISDVISDYTLFTATSSNIISAILDNDMDIYMKDKKPEIENRMKIYTTGFSDEELRNHCTMLCQMMRNIGQNGYTMLRDETVSASAKTLTKMAKAIERNKVYRNKFKDFIKNYEPQIRYAAEPTTQNHIKNYLLESILKDAAIELADQLN